MPTNQQLDYEEQLSFAEFPDEAFRSVAGYEPDPTGTFIERVMIVRQIGQIIYWTAQVNVLEEVAIWEDTTRRLFDLDLTKYRPAQRRRSRG